MCCDICPSFDECQELEKLSDNCCRECPDYAECVGEPEVPEAAEAADETKTHADEREES